MRSVATGPIQTTDVVGKWVAVSVDLSRETVVVQSALGHQLSKQTANRRWARAATKIKAALSLSKPGLKGLVQKLKRPQDDANGANFGKQSTSGGEELSSEESSGNFLTDNASSRLTSELLLSREEEDRRRILAQKVFEAPSAKSVAQRGSGPRQQHSMEAGATIEHPPTYKFTYPASVLTNSRLHKQRHAACLKSSELMVAHLMGIVLYHSCEIILRVLTLALVSSMFRLMYVRRVLTLALRRDVLCGHVVWCCRVVALMVVSTAVRSIVMLLRRNQRDKLHHEDRHISFARVVSGVFLDSVWDFPSQTDMMWVTLAEAVLTVYV